MTAQDVVAHWEGVSSLSPSSLFSSLLRLPLQLSSFSLSLSVVFGALATIGRVLLPLLAANSEAAKPPLLLLPLTHDKP